MLTQEHAQTARDFLTVADEEFSAGDMLQGSEKMWGAAAHAVMAVAQQEMVEEGVSLDDVLEAISQGQVLEDYPRHRRGACCLLYGLTREGRAIHVVCTTDRPTLIIITVYEP